MRTRRPRSMLAALLAAVLLTWTALLLTPSDRRHGRKSLPCPPFGAARAAVSTPDSDPGAETVSLARRLDELGVTAWHAAGYRGRGVTIAVLDSGFCGYRAHLGKALPAAVKVRSFRADGNLEARDSQHGILCAEVLHALAPDAELLLANWEPDRPDTFLEAVKWARAQGARVLTCSVITPTWSDGEGRGAVHQALRRLLGDGDKATDLLLFASAGNTAQRHWTGLFHPGRDGRHEWVKGEGVNEARPWGRERVSVEMCWRGPARYQLTVRDRTNGRTVGERLEAAEDGHDYLAVRFLPQEGHVYGVELRRVGGEAGRFHLVVLGGSLAHADRKGSIPFPGDGPEVVTVGAVGGDGRRLAYSSCGPTSEAPKPDLVAPVPFPSAWRARPFSGTSAASPQAAALAALVLCRHPDWSAARVREALRGAARRTDGTGYDPETGYGVIRLP